jgi:hypothetical protein
MAKKKGKSNDTDDKPVGRRQIPEVPPMETFKSKDIPPVAAEEDPRPEVGKRLSAEREAAARDQSESPQLSSTVEPSPVPTTGKGTNRCLYFPDKTEVEAIERIAAAFPRGSFSGIFQQFATSFLNAVLEHPIGARTIEVKTTIYL